MEQEDYENSLDAIYDEIQDTQFDIPHIIETSDAVAVAAEYGTPNADDSCWILAEQLALKNPQFRIWMGDSKAEEVFCGDPKGITQRLLKMPLLFIANFPLSDAAILGSREGGSQFKWPDITHGFTVTENCCFSAHPILAWVDALLKKNIIFAFFDICAVAGPANSLGAQDSSNSFKQQITDITSKFVLALKCETVLT